MDIEAVIAALGDHYTPERAAIVEREISLRVGGRRGYGVSTDC